MASWISTKSNTLRSEVYGDVVLRRHSWLSEINVHRAIALATSPRPVVPRLVECLHLYTADSMASVRLRLQELGYPRDVFIAAENEGGFLNGCLLSVTEYGGKTIGDLIRQCHAMGACTQVRCISTGLGDCLGRLHKNGIIADDTHNEQFVVDETCCVRRIDTWHAKIRTSALTDHVILSRYADLFAKLKISDKEFDVATQSELKACGRMIDELGGNTDDRSAFLEAYSRAQPYSGPTNIGF